MCQPAPHRYRKALCPTAGPSSPDPRWEAPALGTAAVVADDAVLNGVVLVERLLVDLVVLT